MGMTPLLPEDDAQARYFGLCVLALEEIAMMQDLGLLPRPNKLPLVRPRAAQRLIAELDARGFYYSDDEVTRKEADFIDGWLLPKGDGADGGSDRDCVD
jgi:hypothetical protein